jgi:Flp pilus assembly protein TadG
MRSYRTFRTSRGIHKPGSPAPRSDLGQAVMEFALVAMLFFVIVFCLFDFCWLLFAEMNMQDAVREAGRYASTGQHVTSSSGSLLSRNASIIQVLDSLDMGTTITNVAISSIPSTGGAVQTGSAGGPNDTVTIQATCSLPFLTGFISQFFGNSSSFNFTVSSTFKNEPFPSSQTN